MDISLYRKYRPQIFSDLVGQDHVAITLSNAAKNRAISHAYLFCGPRGTGKTSAARILAKVLNCEHVSDAGEPCLSCRFCLEMLEGKMIDLIEIDAASNRGIDEMRDIREKIKFLPTHAARKIYIIDEVHMLTKEAFNALLKTLEEPPAHAHFVLATTESHKVPETIISRCQRFDFRRIDAEAIAKRLWHIAHVEKIKAEDEALKLIARNVQGGLRDAISLFEQMIRDRKVTLEAVIQTLGIASLESVQSFCETLMEKKLSDLLGTIDELFRSGQDLAQFSREVVEYLREKMLIAIRGNQLQQLEDLMKNIEIFQEASFKLKSALIPQLPLEMAVIEICKTASYSPAPRTHQSIKESVEKKEVAEKIDTPQLVLSDKEITTNFSRILEHIKTPSIKRSFQDAHFEGLKNGIANFTFSSQFHLEKVKSAKAVEEITRAFEALFGSGIKVDFELRKVSFETKGRGSDYEQDEDVSGSVASLSPHKHPSSADDLASSVISMFGGEVIND